MSSWVLHHTIQLAGTALLAAMLIVVLAAASTRRRWHCRRCGTNVVMFQGQPRSCQCSESPSPWEFS